MLPSDFLVIGSGLAGLIYALDVAEKGSVTVLSKREPAEGNTHYAQGGIASVWSSSDTFDSHIADTKDAGAGLCRPESVEMAVRCGPRIIERLVQLGVKFDRSKTEDQFELGREGGHSARRILHAGDATGAEIERAILARALEHPNINVLPFHIAVDLITRETAHGNTEVLGAYALDKATSKITAFTARATMLATGGMGKVYLYTSNPDVATGDGIALAYRAGARIANMEFIQFHPTCLYHPHAKSFLITEAMRGEGAVLMLPDGSSFMASYDARKELAPRDIVARAIDDQMKKTGADHVLLDISHRDASFIRGRFPTIYETCLKFGCDITQEPIPVVPAAHYCCGGVLSGLNGRTDLARLYTAGETACTGLHGANRLASNSLLEAAAFASAAARDTLEHLDDFSMPQEVPEWDNMDTVASSEEVLLSHTWDEVRRMMWNLVGIVRSDKRLALAKRRIAHIREEIRDYYWKFLVTSDFVELRNISLVADIVITSAMLRRESRGLHYNIDCPDRDDANWLKETVVEPDLKPQRPQRPLFERERA